MGDLGVWRSQRNMRSMRDRFKLIQELLPVGTSFRFSIEEILASFHYGWWRMYDSDLSVKKYDGKVIVVKATEQTDLTFAIVTDDPFIPNKGRGQHAYIFVPVFVATKGKMFISISQQHAKRFEEYFECL